MSEARSPSVCGYGEVEQFNPQSVRTDYSSMITTASSGHLQVVMEADSRTDGLCDKVDGAVFSS